MKTLLLVLLAAAFPGVVAAQQAEPGDADMMAAAAQMTQMMQAFQEGTNNPLAALGGKKAVDFRELRALLPAELAGLPRTGTGGEKTGAFGVSITHASGEYGAADGARLELKITDLGAMGPAAAMASSGWAAAEIDREDDAGYERTAEYGGRKGLEQYSTADKSGSAKVMAGGRFMVEISGSDIEPAQLKSAVEAVDFEALERLGNRPQVD